MNKVVRMSMISVIAIAGLFVAALIYFASTFDINNYKDRISKAVKDETGRTLVFKDKLSLTFFPEVGVQLGGVSLSNAKGFGEEPMVEVDSASVSVQILPLLKGEIRFGELELNGLRLNLSRTSKGTTNWDDIVGRSHQAEESKSSHNDDSFSLEIAGVHIQDANLYWSDDKADTHFIVNGMALETGQIYKGAPFPVTASLNFQCDTPAIKGRLTMTGKSSLDFENREYGHMDMKLILDAEGGDVPGEKAHAEATVQFAALDFKSEHAQISGLVLSGYGTTLRMDGTLDGIADGIRKVVATVTADPFDARQTLEALGVTPPNTADETALTKLGGMVELQYKPGLVEVKSMELNLDGTRIVGRGRHESGTLSAFTQANLDVGELDLDRYLPSDHKASTEAAKGEVESGNSDDRVFDSRGLRDLQVDLEAKIAKLRVESMWFDNVKASLKAKDGVLHLSPLSADLYGGTLSAGLTVNVTGDAPQNDIIIGLHHVDVGALSKDVNGDDAYQGILDFNTAASCQGERVPVMLRSMNGKVSLGVADGVFPGVSLISMAKKTHSNKDKGGEVVASKTDSTKFGSIEGTGVIKSGVFQNKDLSIKAPGLRAEGSGAIVLPTQQIDYLLKVKLVATGEGQGGKDSADLYGVMVPIRVGGTLENPRYWVSITEYVKALGGAVIGTAGSLIGGAVNVIKGVGKVVTGNCCDEEEKTGEEAPKRKKFLGIF